MHPTSRLLVLLLVATGCAHQPTEAQRWFSERGAQAKTWDVCLRLAASLRSACDGKKDCEERVTNELTFACYAGRYRGTQSKDAQSSELSPCFWNRSPTTPEAYARAECERLALTSQLQPHCVAELRYLIDDVCKRGHVELTGAGP
jgi:hypothetical protein